MVGGDVNIANKAVGYNMKNGGSSPP